MSNKLLNSIRNFGYKRAFTAERPARLEADVLARYIFAVPFCKGKNIIDIGTGLGLGAEFLAVKGAKDVLGIDYSSATINFITTRNKSKKVKFRKMDALQLEKLNRKFDVVIAFEILEHLPISKVEYFIESVSRILNKKGSLLLSTPNGLMTKYLFGKPYNPYHIKEYTGKEIRELLKDNFTDVRIKGIVYKDTKYNTKQSEIEKSMTYKISYILGHFKIVRELVPFIPKNLRLIVTGEKLLPEYKQNNFKLTDKWQTASGLWIYAKKK